MKLTYLYQSVKDLPAALVFYRDELGLVEAWREGESTVAFDLPGTTTQFMIDVPPDGDRRWSSGGFFEVADVDTFVEAHPAFTWLGDPIDVPGGRSAAFTDPAGNVLHVFDQNAEQAEG
ncbi:MAG: VOC family protein [Jiangellaceae bacterium]